MGKNGHVGMRPARPDDGSGRGAIQDAYERIEEYRWFINRNMNTVELARGDLDGCAEDLAVQWILWAGTGKLYELSIAELNAKSRETASAWAARLAEVRRNFDLAYGYFGTIAARECSQPGAMTEEEVGNIRTYYLWLLEYWKLIDPTVGLAPERFSACQQEMVRQWLFWELGKEPARTSADYNATSRRIAAKYPVPPSPPSAPGGDPGNDPGGGGGRIDPKPPLPRKPDWDGRSPR